MLKSLWGFAVIACLDVLEGLDEKACRQMLRVDNEFESWRELKRRIIKMRL